MRSKRRREQLVHPAAKTLDLDVVEKADQQHRAGQAERGGQVCGGNNTHVGMVRVVTCSAVDQLPNFRDQVDRQKVHGVEQEDPDKHRQRQRSHQLAAFSVVDDAFGLGVDHFNQNFNRSLEPAWHPSRR